MINTINVNAVYAHGIYAFSWLTGFGELSVIENEVTTNGTVSAREIISTYDDEYFDIDRTDTRLVSFIESNNFTQPRCSKLVIKEIPENATDWEISEYDGAEEIICVVDGKIIHL